MEAEGSVPYSKNPTTGPYLKLRASYPICLRFIYILFSHLCRGIPDDLFPSIFPTKPLLVFLYLCYHGNEKKLRM
jgi:hypothetical protein